MMSVYYLLKNLLIRIININKYSILSYKCTNFAP